MSSEARLAQQVSAYDALMEIHLNLCLTQEELNDPRLYRGSFSEVVQVDIDEIRVFVPSASITLSQGSIGKGASNWGVDIVLALTTLANMDALIDLGTRLSKLVRRLASSEAPRDLVLRDETAAGILAVSHYQPSSDLVGGEIIESRCVTGGNLGIGFDARDEWVTLVLLPDKSLVEIRISAAGELLESRRFPPNN